MAVDLAASPDPDNDHHEPIILDRVDYPVVADPNAS